MDTKFFGTRVDTRARRRGVVLALYGSYALLVTCFALGGRSGVGLAFALLLIPAGALLLGSFYTLSQLALPYAEDASGRATMDERQIQVRDRAFYRAYQILSAVFGLWVVYEAIARTNSRGWLWRPETFDEYQALVWGYLLLSATLPRAFIAWTEPDPPEDSRDAGVVLAARTR